MTNGQWMGEWDQWARSKHVEDTRHGRAFFKENDIRIVTGYGQIQAWFKQQLELGRSQLIRDDYAWWHRNGEDGSTGKLLIGIEGVQQVFFDDNIDRDTLRIVDPRSSKTFESVPPQLTLGKVCLRVDPLQAMLLEDYFWNIFDDAGPINDALDFASSKALEEASEREREEAAREREEAAEKGQKKKDAVHEDELEVQLDENDESREAIEVGDLEDLTEILKSAGIDVNLFGAKGSTYKTVQTLYQELLEGKCYLKRNDTAAAEAKDDTGAAEAKQEYPLLRVMEVV